MWHDNETSIDLLDYQYLVDTVIRIIKDDGILPATIGVYGDWGSGKSSLLRMVQENLKKDEDVYTINFNGWLFEGYEDTKSALMGTILEQISENENFGSKVKDKALGLLQKIDWMKVAGTLSKHAIAFAALGPAGLGITTVSDAIAKISEAAKNGTKNADMEKIIKAIASKEEQGRQIRKGIREFHSEFEGLLGETKIKTLVVFIDDLDRCNPDTIIETLEAIRLFLFVKKTAFVIGADERLVKYAVRRRFPEIPGERIEVGRDYLEKLIQFPVRIPQLSRKEIETYINLLFVGSSLDGILFEKTRRKIYERRNSDSFELSFNYGVAKEILPEAEFPKIEAELNLTQYLSPILTVGLGGNPRQCKRFLNTLMMRIGMADSKGIKLEKRILAKLMLLEYFKTEWFKKLAEFQAAQEGRPKEIESLEKQLFSDGKEEEDQSGISKELQEWEADSWMCDWLKSDPKLSKTNLAPYFYFSRDTLSSFASAVQRMSPAAQELISKLLSDSEATRKVAVKNGGNLNEAERAAVFETLCEKAKSIEPDSGGNQILETLIEWSKARGDLLGQLITFLNDFPENGLAIGLVVKIEGAIKDGPFKESGTKLLQKWANSSNKLLAQAANKRLEGSNR